MEFWLSFLKKMLFLRHQNDISKLTDLKFHKRFIWYFNRFFEFLKYIFNFVVYGILCFTSFGTFIRFKENKDLRYF